MHYVFLDFQKLNKFSVFNPIIQALQLAGKPTDRKDKMLKYDKRNYY